MKTTITCKSYFDATHRMSPPPQPEYGRWHGHRYDVAVTAHTWAWSSLPVDVFREGVHALVSAYDHRILTWVGDAEGCKMDGAVVFDAQPTMETIAQSLFDKARDWLKKEHGLQIASVRVSSQPDVFVEVLNDCHA